MLGHKNRHEPVDLLEPMDGVMDCVFHPTQPWLLTCGVDQTIRLFVET